MKLTISNSSRGFVILYAVLLVSIVLVISLSLFNITYKQIVLSQINRESILAFYASDSGLDCALFWDKEYYKTIGSGSEEPAADNKPFGYYDYNTSNFVDSDMTEISCAVDNITLQHPLAGVTYFEVEFSGTPPDNRLTCAEITVTKANDSSDTMIRSDGYNTACGSGKDVPRAVQRSLVTSY